MIKNKSLSSLAFLSLSAGAFACGGGDGGGSGVEGSKALTELDATERQDLCDYGQSLVSDADSTKVSCYFAALFFSETEQDCQTAYDACIADPDDSVEETCSIDEAPPACAADVTVSEIEACAREQAAAVSSLADSLSCASDPAELEDIGELPPACKAVETKCPELFDDEQA